ncbi:epoxide hydrolase [Macrolepiota fuliginosa MF-IS2]|uniref:Epoxide hydrolase n=1 Tax=Macrolepiota fuliginosa MF-IS2 TaxID=1400762 RepID=A0A9P5XJ20_9AGAR|nr:epoxide hydrolase [Macrolepiota fuliginosa MF-IS2]
MDPTRPESFNHRIERLSTGRTYHFVDQLPSGYDPNLNATILCVHGFPDFWYGWRHQIGPWVREGYRVVVPDMLGYGGTDKPWAADEYTTKKLCGDLAALLEAIGIKQAILAGHDWGSHIASRFALWYPNHLVALVILSVPYIPPSPVYLPIEEVAKRAPNLGYQVYFSEQKSTKDIESNMKKFLDIMFHPPRSPMSFTKVGALEAALKGLPSSILSPKEYQYYYDTLSRGMNGPLNYYRTFKQRHEEELAAGLPSNLRSDLPVLFLWGTRDPTATPAIIRKSAKFVPRLQDIALEDRGHWVMVEAKDEVTSHIIKWLKNIGSHSAKAKL